MIKVLVAERNQIFRYGIQSALEPMPDCRIVAEATSTQQLLWCLTSIAHDILLIEADFLGEVGLPVFDAFLIGVSAPRIIVHGMREPAQSVIALRDGASACLMSRCLPSELREAIAQVAMGKRYIDAILAEELASLLLVSPAALPHLLLSRVELRIHKMLVLGLKLSGIAAQSDMSVQDVGGYKQRIREKLELDGIAGLIQAKLDNGAASPARRSIRPASPGSERDPSSAHQVTQQRWPS